MEYTLEQKEQLRNEIIKLQEQSGLSGNNFATQRLGFSSGSKFSHIRNNWDKEGLIGNYTWAIVEKYISKTNEYQAVATNNLKEVWNTCQRAYELKKPMAIVGEGGLGKTFALEKFKQHIEAQKAYEVIYFDASMTKTRKQFIVGLMSAIGCYKTGTMSAQLINLQEQITKGKKLIIIDEASSLEGHNITIIKDVMTAFKDRCGVVFAGTPYFINNLNRGANNDRHLFSETRDRLFMLPKKLERPTQAEALAIFRANGIVESDVLEVLMGTNTKIGKERSWKVKQTFRGIKDCIDLVRMSQTQAFDFNKIQL